MSSLILQLAKLHEANIKEICRKLLRELHDREPLESEFIKFSFVDSFETKTENQIIQTEIHYDHIHLGNIFLVREDGEFQTFFIPKNEL